MCYFDISVHVPAAQLLLVRVVACRGIISSARGPPKGASAPAARLHRCSALGGRVERLESHAPTHDIPARLQHQDENVFVNLQQPTGSPSQNDAGVNEFTRGVT